MGPWQGEVTQAMNASLASSTRASYGRYLADMARFRSEWTLADKWPVPEEHFLQLAVYLKGKGLAVKTIKGFFRLLLFIQRHRVSLSSLLSLGYGA